MEEKLKALRAIPPVNELLERTEIKKLIKISGRNVVTDSIKEAVENFRKSLDEAVSYNTHTRKEISDLIVSMVNEDIAKRLAPTLKRVINATGIVLHTNLGRAPLPNKAIEVIKAAAEGYCNLEFNLETGTRGSRHSHVEALITQITGAESAIIVNNNAAAVFLCLNTFANSKEVIVSRGQQVEIGGSFRIPDIITGSSARMKEVGTTNKTRLSDYSAAVNEDTSVLLKVHTSNYKIIGFTEEVQLKDLVSLGKEMGLIVMEDLGSGSLIDLSRIGLPYEPTVQGSIKSGADIVTFSGDKLLGGPQAGIIAGKKELIEKLKKNPLTRMLRCDKTTIAAITAVLSLYADFDKALENIPVLKMMALNIDELTKRAAELNNLIKSKLGSLYKTEVVDDFDEVGGGSLPGVILNGKAVAITSAKLGVNELQEGLRKASTPVICRINKDRLILNVRTIDEKDYPVIAEALARVWDSI